MAVLLSKARAYPFYRNDRCRKGGQPFRWPAGTYVSNGKFDHIMMAMETSITKDGVTYKEVTGSPSEQEELEKSYEHLCKLRDEVIEMGIIPASKTGIL